MMAHLKDMALFKSQALIGGKWIDATDGRTLPVREPMAFFWEILWPFNLMNSAKKQIPPKQQFLRF